MGETIEEVAIEEVTTEEIGTEERKPAYKTISYWISVLAMIGGMILASGLPSDHVAIKIVGASAVIFAFIGISIPQFRVQKVRPIPGMEEKESTTSD